MEDDFRSPTILPQHVFDLRQTAAINNKYCAFNRGTDVYIQPLTRPDDEPYPLKCPEKSKWVRPILVLSRIRSNILAVSTGPTTYVFDLDNYSVRHVLPGIGRTVTAIAFCGESEGEIVTGHVDGNICFWNFASPKAPSQWLFASSGACQTLATSSHKASVVASIHDDKLHIWSRALRTDRPISELTTTRSSALAWRPQAVATLATTTTDGQVRLYDFSGTLQAANSADSSHSSDEGSDGEVFGQPDAMNKDIRPILRSSPDPPLKSIMWASPTMLLGLADDGEYAFIYGIEESGSKLVQLWSCKFENAAEMMQVLKHGNAMGLVAVGPEGAKYQQIPESTSDTFESEHEFAVVSAVGGIVNVEEGNRGASGHVSAPQTADVIESPRMNPVPISNQRSKASAFEKTSKQLRQSRRLSRSITPERYLHRSGQSGKRASTPSSPPTSHPTSDLEPRVSPDDGDLGSPMPFLSPGIPSTRLLPGDVPPLNDGIFSQLQQPSLPEPISSSLGTTTTNGHYSDDSDDETFIDDMHGHAAFLPGGINVPLPKACGALFSPNGQLLTFFPPKPRPVAVREEVQEDVSRNDRRKGDRKAKLFATFGNLDSDLDAQTESSDSDESLPDSDQGDRDVNLPRLTFQPASFPSQSWKSRDAPAQPPMYAQQSQYKVSVTVHEVTDILALDPFRRDVAKKYRLLCEAGETGTILCEHNAGIAETYGLQDVAEIWRLLAMILSDQVELERLLIGSTNDGLQVTGRRAGFFKETGFDVDVLEPVKRSYDSGKLRWADHPLGGTWLIERVLDWAEQQADVQTLACMSSILSEAGSKVYLKNATVGQSMLSRLPTLSPDYSAQMAEEVASRAPTPVIPVLRTHAATITSLHGSPSRLSRDSELSSRMHSQASTPHLISEEFSFPSISRKSSRLSTSGSVSPELQRGSFSAAAKYYAQSLGEKFTSYGTSPPVKKASASPMTELSSSLPSGSWPGKSVSFASSTTESSIQRSLSISAYATGHDDDGYDSDKTIEDTSLPHTPKSPGEVAVLKLHNQKSFTDDKSGSVKATMLSDELTAKAAIWNQYYVELLRSWEMLEQASELEKVAGLTLGVLHQADFAGMDNAGLFQPASSNQSKPPCAICLTTNKGITQTCPSCLHSSHLKCLEEYIRDSAHEEFTCASGCACLCTEILYVVQELPELSPSRPTFKKKASFTDPRRWRARVGGDSW